MVLPLIAGAGMAFGRVAVTSAKVATKAASKGARAARATTKNARVHRTINRSRNRDAIDQMRTSIEQTDDRYTSIDAKTRNARASYNSVKQNRDLRKQLTDSQAYQTKRQINMQREHALIRKGIASVRRNQQRTGKTTSVARARNKLKIIAVTRSLIWFGMVTWVMLLYFAFWEIIGFGAAFVGEGLVDWIPLFGEFLSRYAAAPGLIIWGINWVVCVVLGLATMLIIAFRYYLAGIKFPRTNLFLVTCALYIVPIIHIFPWFLLYLLTVRYSRA